MIVYRKERGECCRPSGRSFRAYIPTENSPAALNRIILEANLRVQNVKLCVNQLWHKLWDMMRQRVETTALAHHVCTIEQSPAYLS